MLKKDNAVFSACLEEISANREPGWRVEVILDCEPAPVALSVHLDRGKSGSRQRVRDESAMGYFALTTIFALQYLGVVPIPTGLMVATCVAYVLYDTFKR
jgi:hypothetical protein